MNDNQRIQYIVYNKTLRGYVGASQKSRDTGSGRSELGRNEETQKRARYDSYDDSHLEDGDENLWMTEVFSIDGDGIDFSNQREYLDKNILLGYYIEYNVDDNKI